MIDAREDLFLADGQAAGENSLFQNWKSARPGRILRLQDRKEVPEKKAHLLIVSGRGGLLERDIVFVNEEHRRPAEVLRESAENVRQKAGSLEPGRPLIHAKTARTQEKVRLKHFFLNVRQTWTFQEIIVPGHCIRDLAADFAESIRKRRPRESFHGKGKNRNFAHVSAAKVSIPCDGEVFEKRLLPGDIFRIGRINREKGAQRIEKERFAEAPRSRNQLNKAPGFNQALDVRRLVGIEAVSHPHQNEGRISNCNPLFQHRRPRNDPNYIDRFAA